MGEFEPKIGGAKAGPDEPTDDSLLEDTEEDLDDTEELSDDSEELDELPLTSISDLDDEPKTDVSEDLKLEIDPDKQIAFRESIEKYFLTGEEDFIELANKLNLAELNLLINDNDFSTKIVNNVLEKIQKQIDIDTLVEQIRNLKATGEIFDKNKIPIIIGLFNKLGGKIKEGLN